MKKLLTLLMVGLLVITSLGTAFAQEPNFVPKAQNNGLRYEALKEFVDEIHKINELRMERLELKSKQIEKNDSIIDLYIKARENKDKEALLEAREVRKQIKDINLEIKDLHKQLVEERKAFKDAVKNNDFEEAEEHITEVISLKEQINNKVGEKLELLDEIIEILS